MSVCKKKLLSLFTLLKMKKHLLYVFLICIALPDVSYAQFTISPTTTLPVNLNSGVNWTAGSGCTNTGTRGNISFNVSNFPPLLTSTFTLSEIRLSFASNTAACGTNFRDLRLMLKKQPNGPCYIFYDGNPGSPLGASTLLSSSDVTFYLRDNPNCGANISWMDFNSTWDIDRTTSGNTGYFKAGCNSCGATQSSTTTLQQAFNNINPNGTWTIYGQYSGAANNAPCLTGVNLSFGNPAADDRRPDGEDCSTAITYTGTPICAQTGTKSGSALMPGSLCGANTNTFGTIGGVNCAWNAANNNDVWVKYQPTSSGYFCLSISGLGNQQQTIVVEDANADNDNNPCTGQAKTCALGGDDPNWKVVSCGSSAGGPYPSVTTGTLKNQQHCFLVQSGKTYFLVIDGNGGAESPFYINGLRGISQATLSDAFIKLTGEHQRDVNNLKWEYVLDHSTIKRYELERSSNGSQFYQIYSQLVSSSDESVTQYTDQSPLPSANFYRLKVVLKDGTVFYSSVVELKGKGINGISVYPNPVVNDLHISAANKIDQINIFNSQGQLFYSDASVSVQTLKISTLDWNKGQYLVVVRDILGNIETTRIVK